MKKSVLIVLLAVILFLFGIILLAKAIAGEKLFSATGKISISAPYVSEATGEYVSGGAVTQPSATITHTKSKISLTALAIITSDSVKEVDLLLEKTLEIKGAIVTGGVGIYDVERIGNVDGDFFAVYANIDFPEFLGIIPFLYVESNTPIREEFGEGGILWKTGIKKNLKITEQQRIDLKLEVGGNDGIYGSAPMPVAFARGIVSAEINLGKLKIVPSLTIQKGFGGIAEEEKVILGISIPF
jgi:hypothetical protein